MTSPRTRATTTRTQDLSAWENFKRIADNEKYPYFRADRIIIWRAAERLGLQASDEEP